MDDRRHNSLKARPGNQPSRGPDGPVGLFAPPSSAVSYTHLTLPTNREV